MGLASYRRTVSETKRAAILRAARDNFLNGGFTRAAMADIARDADVSTATLYKHFSSKNALFAAIVEDACASINDILPADIANQNAREVLRRFADAYVEQQFDHRMNELLRVVIAEVPNAPELASSVYANGVMARYDRLMNALDALVERGDLKPHNTRDGALHLGGMVKEFIVWPALFSPRFEKPADLDAKIDACIDAFLKIYGN
ncbi:TetR/AcrR family transcriptional regulator [Parvibaculum sp.]|uniref:TetR/AcrR family transcriptional regulator n=1 Tax=Parvibaculum sp. TaxID=2024848 RepID=UPI00391DCA2E